MTVKSKSLFAFVDGTPPTFSGAAEAAADATDAVALLAARANARTSDLYAGETNSATANILLDHLHGGDQAAHSNADSQATSLSLSGLSHPSAAASASALSNPAALGASPLAGPVDGASINTGQLWFYSDEATGANGPTDGNVDNVGYSNTTYGPNQTTPVVGSAGGFGGQAPGYSLQQAAISTGLDTANNLLFVLADNGADNSPSDNNNGTIYVFNQTTGALLSHQEIGNFENEDSYGPMAIDPLHHLVYVDIFGGPITGTASDRTEDEILAVPYNPVSGSLSVPAYNPVTQSQSSNANTVISNQSDSNFSQGSLALDQTTQTLYFSKDDVQDYQDPAGNDYPLANEIDAISAVVRNGTSFTHITSLPTSSQQGYPGEISSFAIDDPDNLIFFTTVETENSSNAVQGSNSIWYAPLSGGTAKQLNTGSTTFIFYDNSISFDPVTKQLYVANGSQQSDSGPGGTLVVQDPGEIYRYNIGVSAGTASITAASTFFTYGSASAKTYFANIGALTFNSLPVLATTGTATYAGQNGSAVTVLAGGTTVTDSDSGGFITSATVQITKSGTAQAGDVLSINGSTFGSGATSFTDTNGAIFNISYSSTSGTLTITSPVDPTSGATTTDAQYAHLLSEIQYTDGYTDTSSGAHPTRLVTLQVNDGAAGTPTGVNAATTTITINRAPTMSAGGSVSYTPGGAGAKVDAGLTVSDLDGDSQTSASVALTSGFVSGDALSATLAGNIQQSYNTATGVLTLTGGGTVAQYQQVIASVTFTSTAPATANAASFPNAGGRTVGYAVNDGQQTSGIPTSSLTVVATSFADTAANVKGDLDALNGDASITAITITDGQPLTVTQTQFNADAHAIGLIAGAYKLDETSITNQNYTAELMTYDAAHHLTEAVFSGYMGAVASLDETFDGAGRLATAVSKDGGGATAASATYSYDQSGAETVVTDYASRPYASETKVFDTAGHLVSRERDGFTGPFTTETFTYDASGALTSSTQSGFHGRGYAAIVRDVDATGRLTHLGYEDAQGNEISATDYAADGSYTKTTTSPTGAYTSDVKSYDASGHLLSDIYTGLTGRAYTGATTTYDSAGHTLSLDQTGFMGAYTEQRFDYASGAQAVRTRFNTDGTHAVDALVTGAALVDTSASETFGFTSGDSFALSSASFGTDTIKGYHPGQASFTISTSVFANFQDLYAHSAPDGHATLITLDANDALLLAGVTQADLQAHQGDFTFV